MSGVESVRFTSRVVSSRVICASGAEAGAATLANKIFQELYDDVYVKDVAMTRSASEENVELVFSNDAIYEQLVSEARDPAMLERIHYGIALEDEQVTFGIAPKEQMTLHLMSYMARGLPNMELMGWQVNELGYDALLTNIPLMIGLKYVLSLGEQERSLELEMPYGAGFTMICTKIGEYLIREQSFEENVGEGIREELMVIRMLLREMLDLASTGEAIMQAEGEMPFANIPPEGYEASEEAWMKLQVMAMWIQGMEFSDHISNRFWHRNDNHQKLLDAIHAAPQGWSLLPEELAVPDFDTDDAEDTDDADDADDAEKKMLVVRHILKRDDLIICFQCTDQGHEGNERTILIDHTHQVEDLMRKRDKDYAGQDQNVRRWNVTRAALKEAFQHPLIKLETPNVHLST